jgi:hypothetical protein
MQEPDPFLVFVEPLNRAGIPYMVTGSIAGIVYGEPRVTHDVDLVVELHVARIESFITLFPLDRFYCPPEAVIRSEVQRETRGHFNLICHANGYKADIYPIGRDPLHAWAMGIRRCVEIGGIEVWLAPPEYVILRKLQFYQEGGSDKHLRDIRNMLEMSASLIDQGELEARIAQLGLAAVWAKVSGRSEA